jgi:hypothetical protein
MEGGNQLRPDRQLFTLDCDEGRFIRHLANVRNSRKLVEIARMICRMVGP